ncbi:hypothetical protein VT930_11840 [Mycobacterium sherrisii]|uniref:hypothetical protein n=1 Tax=Mycobacterium sherrisii TaxID=243061 RepID=UPI002DDD8C33|nr:hypothetical protein [Mycobacterium sherrisii]MEC4763795.1 hypothetical protein [Mycobacterium sherrisii]
MSSPSTTEQAGTDTAVAEKPAEKVAQKVVPKEDRVKVHPPREVRQAEAEREARQLDTDLRAAARTATDSLARVAMLVQQAQEREIWKHVTDSDGQPYKSWHGYITDVCSAEMGPLAAVNRNALVKMLLDAGLSQRAAAEVAKTSPATANRIAQGETPGERNPAPRPSTGGAPKGQPQQRSNPADAAWNALDRVIRRAQTYPDDLPIQDIERLIPKCKQAVTALNKVVKEYNAAVTEAQKRHPAGAKKKPDTAA